MPEYSRDIWVMRQHRYREALIVDMLNSTAYQCEISPLIHGSAGAIENLHELSEVIRTLKKAPCHKWDSSFRGSLHLCRLGVESLVSGLPFMVVGPLEGGAWLQRRSKIWTDWRKLLQVGHFSIVVTGSQSKFIQNSEQIWEHHRNHEDIVPSMKPLIIDRADVTT